ncbi:MAG: cobyrinate a,c-diamide synthase [Stellaceae bacterium]
MPGRGLILAAPSSGSGKTLVTAGLLRQLSQCGIRAAAAKAGPDFIDPTFLAAAGGAPCINLDAWAMRPETLRGLVAALEAHSDIVLCEGVMGLFDGTGADGEAGSTAELAALTGWPVVLIVDARGQGASVAALLRGFAGHRPELPLAGVILNRVASERHRALITAAVARHLPDLAILGAFPADPALALPSRHLGLVPAAEFAASEAVLARAAGHVGEFLEVKRLLDLARPSRMAFAIAAPSFPPLGQRIAVARDDAFCFIYPAILDGWRQQGADLAFFSPLAGEPPDGTADAVYLPGGYPELWAGRLAAAEAFFMGLRRAAAAGKPVYGECGGYMVLGEALTEAKGQSYPMAGLLPFASSFAERRRSLGYRIATLLADTPLGTAGSRFCGHEFHYATILRDASADGPDRLWSATDAAGFALGPCGSRRGTVFGSFLHLIDRVTSFGMPSYRASCSPSRR